MRILPPTVPDLILPMRSADVHPRTLLTSLDLVRVSSPADVVVDRPTKKIVSAGCEEDADRESSVGKAALAEPNVTGCALKLDA